MLKNFHGNKKPYLIRISCAAVIFVLTTLAFFPAFKPLAYVLQLNFGAAGAKLISDFSLITLAVVLINILVAYFFGRIYCSVICPFGILQDILGTIFRRKSGACKNFYYIRYTIFAVVLASMIVGATAVLRYLDPYSNYGNLVTGFISIKTASVLTFIPLVILAALVLWKNRIFCTTICPVGTALGLCSKFSSRKMYISQEICKKCGQCEKECPTGAIISDEKSLDNERCIRCMRCVTKCPGNGILFGNKKEKIKFEPSRRNFITTGIVVAAAVAVFAKGKDIVKTVVEGLKKRPICPPGAGSVERFVQKCTNCGLCVQHCKGKILKKPDSEYETVHIDFSEGKCEFDCKNCSDICPTGALRKMSLKEKQNCRIGLVKLDYEKCTKCGLCARICPKQALEHKAGSTPVYIAKNCIGCGACQNICPAKAIEIVSINEQSQI